LDGFFGKESGRGVKELKKENELDKIADSIKRWTRDHLQKNYERCQYNWDRRGEVWSIR